MPLMTAARRRHLKIIAEVAGAAIACLWALMSLLWVLACNAIGWLAAVLLFGWLLGACAARPALAAEADSPGWRFMEAVDGDTLAFAVDALPPALSRVLVRVRGVDTPERRRPKCEWERRAGKAATACTAAALEAARTIDLADMKWGKYSGRVLTRAPVDGRDPVEASIADGHGRPYDGGRRAREAAA